MTRASAEGCEDCARMICEPATDDGEWLCEDCVQNRNERAYEQLCADFHDGGSTRFRSLQDQQNDARRFK